MCTKLGSLKTRVSYSSFRLLVIGKKSTYVVNMGENLTFENFQYVLNLEISCNFFLDVVISISKPMKNHSNITHVPNLSEIAEVNGNRSHCLL